MNWEAIGAIGEIVGAFGVIATLLSLSIQVRSNSTAIRAQMYQARLTGLPTRHFVCISVAIDSGKLAPGKRPPLNIVF